MMIRGIDGSFTLMPKTMRGVEEEEEEEAALCFRGAIWTV